MCGAACCIAKLSQLLQLQLTIWACCSCGNSLSITVIWSDRAASEDCWKTKNIVHDLIELKWSILFQDDDIFESVQAREGEGEGEGESKSPFERLSIEYRCVRAKWLFCYVKASSS